MIFRRSCAFWLLMGLLLATLSNPLPVEGGEILDAVKSRNTLRCGVSEGIAGFSERDSSGRWVGIDADFCRAVAAVALGDPEKVTYVPLRAAARFPVLQAGKIDLLARNTSWTLGREAGLKAQFPVVLYFDSQGFMVPRQGNIGSVEQLGGLKVCIEKGTTSEQHLADFSASKGLHVQPLIFDSVKEVTEAFFAGRCQAYTSDISQLAAVRLRAPGNPQDFVILPERISKEPLGPVVRRGDDDWFTLVRWTLFALIAAEEIGLTRDNIDQRLKETNSPALRRAAGLEGGFGPALGVSEGWVVRAVKAAGNYGEMFERNLGSRSRLQLERGLNQLWTKGGLHYAPPMQ
jgi:general L-amino acid transport system substrate-binding protein